MKKAKSGARESFEIGSTFAAVLLASASVTSACSNDPSRRDPTVEPQGAAPAAVAPAAPAPLGRLNPRLLRRFLTVRKAGFDPSPNAELSALGQQLFHERRLSVDSTMSCNTCHDVTTFGVDHLATSPGVNKRPGARNSPTVFNAAGHFTQFWDGRSGSVEAQALGPIVNPAEMAMPSAEAVVARLEKIPGYVEQFARVFKDSNHPITFSRVGEAIGAFERRLSTPGRWDSYLDGDEGALTLAEREGLRTFLNVGCMVCHTGALLGGATFERVGVVEPWPNQSDVGRMSVTGNAADRMSFKVPSLRNVGETAPYFHDGSAATLEDAVRMMGRHQLGLELTAGETISIATWLRSLTGTPPAEVLGNPVLPK